MKVFNMIMYIIFNICYLYLIATCKDKREWTKTFFYGLSIILIFDKVYFH